MAEKKPYRQVRLDEITRQIEAGIQDVFTSGRYEQYLKTMSRFHKYSVNNSMLIYMQKPDATLVAGYSRWKEQFGRQVLRGEKGITIIAPSPVVVTVSARKLDPATQEPFRDESGQEVLEEKQVRVPMFHAVKVFDVSQTQGRPLPKLAADLSGNVENYGMFLEALKRASPVPVSFEPLTDGSDGSFSVSGQSITIRDDMSQVQTVSALVHEMAHAMLHNPARQEPEPGMENPEASHGVEPTAPEPDSAPEPRFSLREAEIQAESVSYAVCAYYGIETGENSFGYLAGWSRDRTLPELRASLELIQHTASELIDRIDQNMGDLVLERERAAAQAHEVITRAIRALDQEKLFRNIRQDCYLIYQLKEDPDLDPLRFMGSDYLAEKGLAVRRESYHPVYTSTMDLEGSREDKLNRLYELFNRSRPEGFEGHSLSVSDVVCLKENGSVSAHYVDLVGFRELPDFTLPEPYLKNAELSMEDDRNMLDGILNNGRRGETEERPDPAGAVQDVLRRELPTQGREPDIRGRLRTPLHPMKTDAPLPGRGEMEL